MTKDQKIEAAAKSQAILDRATSKGKSAVYSVRKFQANKDKIRAKYNPDVIMASIVGLKNYPHISEDTVMMFQDEMLELAKHAGIPDAIGVYNYTEDYAKEMGLSS